MLKRESAIYLTELLLSFIRGFIFSYYHVVNKKFFIKTLQLVIGLFLSIPFLLNGQNISLQIVDKEDGQALVGATAINEQSSQGAVSNAEGFIIIAKAKATDKITFRYLGYREQHFDFQDLPEIVYLESISNLLNAVTVYAKTEPTPLTSNEETIKDFIIQNDQVLMLSKQRGNKFILKLGNLDADQISTTQIKPRLAQIEGLYTSCTGSHYIVGAAEVIQIHIDQDSILIIDRANRRLFDKLIAPCLAENASYFYFQESRIKNQIASIYAINKTTKERFLFTGVKDDENIMRFPYEVAYMNYADGTGPLYLGLHAQDPNDAIQWGDMLNRVFYTPVDYFLMSQEERILLFDHEKSYLYVFNLNGERIAKHPIDYPKQKGWNTHHNMYIDEVTQELYAVHKIGVNKYFTLIDLNSGATLKRYILKEPFMENMAIYNGVVYFTNSTAEDGARILKKLALELEN